MLRFNRVLWILLILSMSVAAGRDKHGPATEVAPPVAVEAGISRELASHRAGILSDIHYTLAFRIPEAPDQPIDATVEIAFQLAEVSAPLQLDFRESGDKLETVSVNGRDSDYRFSSEHLLIPASELTTGSNRINISLQAGSTSLNRNPDYLYALLVPDRARTVFPLFDQPDLKARYSLTLELPAHWSAMANAPLATLSEDGGRATHTFQTSDPISSYLFSFVAGEFQSITRELDGRPVTMLHRESDPERVAQNVDQIFALHRAALRWLEDYTGIDYPFQKFDFALIPAHPYGGMEHVGSIQYKSESLLLDPDATQSERLDRASLIAHETAHMWFGNLVTMRWFDDVWTKEVFANFMAAKIVNPGFPEVDHELNFLVDHHPRAYAVDRSEGANPIRQPLANLQDAGSLYGAIIYQKAPIMMRQLEALVGEEAFRAGMHEYLGNFAFGNASWPELIAILDRRTDQDLAAWSKVWVNSAGRPHFAIARDTAANLLLQQSDPLGKGRVWPQVFGVSNHRGGERRTLVVNSAAAPSPLATGGAAADTPAVTLIFNSDGMGYGRFPAKLDDLDAWDALSDVEKGSLLVNLFENMLDGLGPPPAAYLAALRSRLPGEDNPLLIDLALDQVGKIFWDLLPEPDRRAIAGELESALWSALAATGDPGVKRLYFQALSGLSLTPESTARLHSAWSGETPVPGITLSERDRVSLAQALAIREPDRAQDIISRQLGQTDNADTRRKLQFIAPALSADQATRDAFFASLADPGQRQTESWVVAALAALHHPLRREVSERYILPSLELLEEIRVSGDIFFPTRWLQTTLSHYHSDTAVRTVRGFLAGNPALHPQLRLKLLQAADPLFRANRLLEDRE